MKKKVGIITFHCSHNYGSVLQAYALQKYLSNKGFDVKIINYTLSWDFEYYKVFRTKLYKRNKRAILSDLVYLKKNIKRKRSFEKFAKDHLKTTEEKFYDFQIMNNLNKQFDIFICGSDQIWNFDCTKEIIPAYFLDFADEGKLKIAYAPSMAHSEFHNIDRNKLKELLDNIDFISVREKSNISMLKGIVDKNIECTLDPTLLLNGQDYEDLIEKYNTKEKYIFMYTLEENKEIFNYCRKLAVDKKMTVYYIRKKNIGDFPQAKNVYGISPGQFLYLIKNAESVITNSFHATVFSVLFKKKFITFKTQKSYLRMTDLLTNINLDNRIFGNSNSLEEFIDYENVYKKLIELRKKSECYLENALSSTF